MPSGPVLVTLEGLAGDRVLLVSAPLAAARFVPSIQAPWFPRFGPGAGLLQADLGASETLDVALTPPAILTGEFRVLYLQAVHVSAVDGVVAGAPKPWIVLEPAP